MHLDGISEDDISAAVRSAPLYGAVFNAQRVCRKESTDLVGIDGFIVFLCFGVFPCRPVSVVSSFWFSGFRF